MRKITAHRSEKATNESWLKIPTLLMECDGDGDMHILVGATADETARVPVTCEVPGDLEAGSHEISVSGDDMMPPFVLAKVKQFSLRGRVYTRLIADRGNYSRGAEGS